MIQELKRGLRQQVGRVVRKHFPPYPYRHYHDATRAIFIHIPKNAGTSILAALGAPRHGRLHLDYTQFERSDGERFRTYFKFAMLRDPADRLSSVYRYLSRGGNQDQDDLKMKELIEADCGSFEDFVLKFLTPSRVACWDLLRPQSSYICDRLGNVRVDFVMRYEQIDSDYEELKERLPVLADALPQLNTSRKQDRVPLADGVLDRIREIYADDYERFYQEA